MLDSICPSGRDFLEVSRNRKIAVNSADSVDTMVERKSDSKGAAERAENKFDTMLDIYPSCWQN